LNSSAARTFDPDVFGFEFGMTSILSDKSLFSIYHSCCYGNH